MRIEFSKGKYGLFSEPGEAVDYLKSFKIQNIPTEPEKIFIRNEGKSLFLVIFDGMTRQYKIRRSFLEKLMKWYSFPIRQLEYFDIDTITAMCNDYIINIKASNVNIKIEDGEALTITSEKFSEMNDIKMIKRLKPHGIESIFIDDYSTKIRIEQKHSIKPFPGDEFGMGMMVSNSETGFGAIRIKDFLLRYICTNGAYINESKSDLKYYHYNLFVQDVYDTIDWKLNNMELRGKVIEERLKKMAEPISKETVVSIHKEIMRNTAVKLLNDVMETDRMLTKYELFNLITDRAKEFKFNIRTRIEEIAGNLV